MTLEIKSVTLQVPVSGRIIVRDLSIVVGKGKIVTVVGRSGAGKSTLLDFIGGYLDPAVPAAGRILIDGTDVTDLPAELRHIGVLFQDAQLFPHLSVGENLAFGLPSRIGGRKLRRDAVAAALDKAGLAGFADRDPATLSGGERARAALMRTLLSEPRALLLDEPFSRLDPDRRKDVRAFVFAQARERMIPVLLVTHDADDAAAAAGSVITLGEL